MDKEKTICRHIRDLYKYALQNGCDDIVEKIELIYIMAKKMNRKLCEYAGWDISGDGFTEKFWHTQLKQLKRGWKK